MEITDSLIIAGISVFSYMTLLYLLAQIKRDTSIVDIGWGLGFVLIALNLCLQLENPHGVYKLVAVLVSIWGLRLFTHILVRKAGKPEDWRYANWREEWGGNHWWRSFLQVFMLQGFMMMLIAAPLFVAWTANEPEIGPLMVLGAAVWALGFFFESVGDYQLTKFINTKKRLIGEKKSKRKKSNEFMMEGLWRYTRHPNYFGEVTQWWGLWLIVVSLEYGLFALISPLTITFLLLKVSGIPMLEKKWEGNKQFEKYKQKTNAFFPGPPKKR